MQKGYRVFDHLAWKVFYSRNVKFDEQEMERPQAEEEEFQRRPLVLDPVMASPSDGEGNYKGEKDTREDTPVVAEILRRRSTRKRRSVDYYSFSQAHLTTYCEPTSFEEATN